MFERNNLGLKIHVKLQLNLLEFTHIGYQLLFSDQPSIPLYLASSEFVVG